MPELYPFHLRTIQQASKSRSQPASFRVSEPRRGYGYAQEIGTDTPVFWDVQFRFTSSEATAFQLWFLYNIKRGVDEFLMPIKTEFGLVAHTCRFLPDSLLDTNEDGQTWVYTAQIMARAQVVPTAYSDAADLIVTLPDWAAWAGLLDETVTKEMPT